MNWTDEMVRTLWAMRHLPPYEQEVLARTAEKFEEVAGWSKQTPDYGGNVVPFPGCDRGPAA